eukprot:CAMPEP_0113666430 /NCGR_PEP_ID=MMETSP0038_2-20120614/2868_1 /TAXON_ID=2898 /ORGANISM="Cryptomonas paramecium" /LENGTH=171 /DNA_ID=CAMNT_0000581917 /DNA_START=39 /DNA_END=554 /DNA_ORIENTATION=+ /assembly_acc=CAM_ASM_000170
MTKTLQAQAHDIEAAIASLQAQHSALMNAIETLCRSLKPASFEQPSLSPGPQTKQNAAKMLFTAKSSEPARGSNPAMATDIGHPFSTATGIEAHSETAPFTDSRIVQDPPHVQHTDQARGSLSPHPTEDENKEFSECCTSDVGISTVSASRKRCRVIDSTLEVSRAPKTKF